MRPVIRFSQRLVGRFSRRQLMIGTVGALLVLLAAGLSLYQFGLRKPVATPTILVRTAKGALPTEPWDPAWRQVSAVTMPLTITSTPGAPQRNVEVKAVTDGTNLVMRAEWADEAKNVTTLRPQDFGDQAALMLSEQLTSACMGQLNGTVNIWQWKADWQEGTRDMRAAFPNMLVDGFWDEDGKPLLTEDLFSRPAFTVGNARAAATKEQAVEYLIADGFSTLTSAGSNPMLAKGEWQAGKWAVVFARPLVGQGGDVSLTTQAPLQAAFAVWDGQQMQRDGMKYVTSWVVLQLGGK